MPRPRVMMFFAVITILLFPRHAQAGLLDIIWEMSGPRLIGFGLPECRIGFGGERGCYFLLRWYGGNPSDSPEPALWVSVEPYVYFSDGTTRNGIDFKLGQPRMLGIDPMLGFTAGHRNRSSGFRYYNGIGFSYNRLSGHDLDEAVNNYAVKVRLAGLAFRTGSLDWDLAYNLRIYADGFSVDALRSGQLLAKEDAREVVQGAVVTIGF